MRSILSVSLPAWTKKEIEDRAQKTNLSVSAYIIRVVEFEKSLISEDELLKMAKKAEKDYRNGKTKKLKSLMDLCK